MNEESKPFQDRTAAKLRYARVHLDELAAMKSLRGDDLDRAHQESYLFHLLGARDAFLAELNHYYRIGLPNENLSPGRLWKELKERGIQSAELTSLFELDKDETSWFRQAKDMRDHSTHVQGVSRTFFVGGDEDGQVKLKNPRTGALADRHVLDEFRHWFEQMRSLIEKLRHSALACTVSNTPWQGAPPAGHR
jgi:hypothetical protein